MFQWARLGIEVVPKGIKDATDQLSKLAKKAKAAEDAADGIRGKSGKAGSALQRFGEKIDKLLGPLGRMKGLLAGLGFAALVGGMTLVTAKVIQTGAQFEALGVQMEAVTGSAQAAGDAMDFVKKMTADTPYQLDQMGAAFVKMTAMGLDPMGGHLKVVADMTSYLGGEIETLNTITMALGKGMTKGKLQTEELIIMAERGVPVFKILSEKLGVTEGAIFEMAKEGAIGRDKIELLIQGMDDLAGGASLQMMKTFNGAWSNLQDNIAVALDELSREGVLDGATKAIQGINTALQQMSEAGVLELIGVEMAQAFMDLNTVLGPTADGIMAVAMGWTSLREAMDFRELDGLMDQFTRAENKFNYYTKVVLEDGLSGVMPSQERVRALEEATAEYNKLKPKVDALTASTRKYQEIQERLAKAMNGVVDETEELNKTEKDRKKTVEDVNEVVDEQLEKDLAWEQQAQEMTETSLALAAANHARYMQQITDLGIEAQARAALSAQMSEEIIKGGSLATVKLKEIQLNDVAKQQILDIINALEQKANAESAWADMWASLGRITTQTLSEALWGGLTGELDSIEEVFQGWFEKVGQNGAQFFSQELMNAFSNPELFKSSFGITDGKLGAGSAALGMAIGGGIYQRGQENYSKGQGAAGGAIMGASMGAQAGGGWGALIGGILGGAFGYLTTDGDAPVSSYNLNYGGNVTNPYAGEEYTGWRWDNRMPDRAGGGSEQDDFDRTFGPRMYKLYSEMKMAMVNTLSLFGDASLFELLPEIFKDIEVSVEGGYEALAKYLTEVSFRQAFDDDFGEALAQGFANLGISEPKLEELRRNLQLLSTADAGQALDTYIQAVVNSAKLMEELDWGRMIEVATMDTREAFTESHNSMMEQLDLLLAPWDNLTLIEQAEQAGQIIDLVEQARQAELQYLQQIIQLSDQIENSINKQIESLRLGGMDDPGKFDYVSGSLADIFAQLGEEGLAPETISMLTGDAQGYISMLEGIMGENIDKPFHDIFGDGGIMSGFFEQFQDVEGLDTTGTGRDFLISLLEALNEQSQTRLQEIQDEINARHEEYISILDEMHLSLTGTTGGLDDLSDALRIGSEAVGDFVEALYDNPNDPGDDARSGGIGSWKPRDDATSPNPWWTPYRISDGLIGGHDEGSDSISVGPKTGKSLGIPQGVIEPTVNIELRFDSNTRDLMSLLDVKIRKIVRAENAQITRTKPPIS